MTLPRWLTHFGLTSPPFTKAVADEDLWVPASRKRIVERLVDACRTHEHVILTGEPGIGKTCVLRALRRRLPEAGFRLTYCHNATLGRRDFYRQLCLALGLSPSATAAAVFYAINQHVRELGSERVHPVFLLDESHLLPASARAFAHPQQLRVGLRAAALARARRLVRAARSDAASQESLALLEDPHAPAPRRLRPDDTYEYVEHRLRLAGSDKDPFDGDALALLHEASGGRLRDIDRIATDALKRASRKKLKRVDRKLLESCVDLDAD